MRNASQQDMAQEDILIDRRHVLSMGAALGTTMLLPGTEAAASAPDLGSLRRRLAVGRAQFRSARYADLTEALPALLRDALAALAQTTGARQQAVNALLARVHILASELAVKSGDSDEAWDRARCAVAAGESSGDVLVLAEATRICATPLRRQGRAADAVLLLQDMITTLADAASGVPEPPLVTAGGSLALTAAYSAALEGRQTTAMSLMDMAADAAARLARTTRARSSGLTTDQVHLYQVGVHHLLGQDITAVRTAQRIHAGALPTSERRARLGTDTARALIAVGDYGRALTALRAVEDAAAEEACRPSVRALTRELLVRRPRLTGLDAFAARTGAGPR